MSQRVLQKNPLKFYSMVRAGILGSLCENAFWAENDMYKLREICFLYKARCFRVYLKQITYNPGGKSNLQSTVLLLKHILNSETIFDIRVNEWLNNL